MGDRAREIVDDRRRVLFVLDLNSALVLCGYGPAPLDPLPISLPDLPFLWPEPGIDQPPCAQASHGKRQKSIFESRRLR